RPVATADATGDTPSDVEALDVKGAVLLVLTLVAALTGLARLAGAIDGPRWPGAAAIGAALLLGALFVRHERRTSSPIMPLTLLADRELRVALWVTTLAGLALYTVAIFTPLMLQGSLGLSPTRAGLAVTPMVFGLVAGGIAAGVRISKRGRYRSSIAAGLWLGAIAGGLLAHQAPGRGGAGPGPGSRRRGGPAAAAPTAVGSRRGGGGPRCRRAAPPTSRRAERDRDRGVAGAARARGRGDDPRALVGRPELGRVPAAGRRH